MLATRSTSRIVAHERPDVIEVGSAYFAPWLIFRARRQYQAPGGLVLSREPASPRGTAAGPRAGAAPRTRARRRLVYPAHRGGGGLHHRGVRFCATRPRARRRDQRGVRAARCRPRPVPSGPTRHRSGGTGAPWPARRARWRCTSGRFAPGEACGPARHGLGRGVSSYRCHARHGGRGIAAPADSRRSPGPGLVVLGYTRTRETIADLHAAADFYVSPCPYETFGLAALEALASGTPVLSADDGRRLRAGHALRGGLPLSRRRTGRAASRGRVHDRRPIARRSAVVRARTRNASTAGTACSIASSRSTRDCSAGDPARFHSRCGPSQPPGRAATLATLP